MNFFFLLFYFFLSQNEHIQLTGPFFRIVFGLFLFVPFTFFLSSSLPPLGAFVLLSVISKFRQERLRNRNSLVCSCVSVWPLSPVGHYWFCFFAFLWIVSLHWLWRHLFYWKGFKQLGTICIFLISFYRYSVQTQKGSAELFLSWGVSRLSPRTPFSPHLCSNVQLQHQIHWLQPLCHIMPEEAELIRLSYFVLVQRAWQPQLTT